jgi:hypothetical protein
MIGCCSADRGLLLADGPPEGTHLLFADLPAACRMTV